MLKVGIIGCGKMADQHATQIQKIPGVEIIAVCDKETLMAQDLSERLNIRRHFTGVEEMLQTVKLDVVHITTPPQSHHTLAKLCLESGAMFTLKNPSP